MNGISDNTTFNRPNPVVTAPIQPVTPPLPVQSAPPRLQPTDRFTPSAPEEGQGRMPNFLGALQQNFGVDTSSKTDTSPVAAAGATNPQADPYFSYPGVPWTDHSKSIAWTPGSKGESPTQANQAITNGYIDLNGHMQNYLQGDPNGPKLPELADWTTFGKYASREAGEQIRNLEDKKRFEAGDIEAGRRMQRNMTNLTTAQQAAGMGLGSLQESSSKIDPQNLAANPLNEVGKTLGNTVADAAIVGPDAMLNALVKGNNGIYNNFAPAYDAFLKGEASGQDGLKSLAEAGYTPGSKNDPQGFITSALTNYKEARQLGLQAQQESDPTKRQQLLDQRKQLVSEANLNLGNQEQMEVIQQPGVFGDPIVARNIGAIGGTMAVNDANGQTPLLPDGGNWSDFQTRMGFKEVEPGSQGAMEIRDPQGQLHHYAVDPNAKGTISDYFNQNTDGPRAAKLNSSNPRSLYEPTTSVSGSYLDETARHLNHGNYGQAASSTATALATGGAEILESGGQAVAGIGRDIETAGADFAGQGINQGGLVGAAKFGLGVGATMAGEVADIGGYAVDKVGGGLKFSSEVAKILWDDLWR